MSNTPLVSLSENLSSGRSHNRSNEGTAPTRPTQVLRSGGSVAPTSKNHLTVQPHEPVQRPHKSKKTLPRVPSQRLTLMSWTQTCQSSPSIFESEPCQKSSKVRLGGTSNLPHLKCALTRCQSSGLSLRSMRHGSPWLWGTRKLIQPGTICLGKNCASFNVILPNPNLRLHLHRDVDLWSRAVHPL